jgi:hypothetical protein
MALPALLGAGLKTMGGGLVKGAAKGAATNFIKSKKTEVKPEAVKGERVEEKKPGALAVRPKTTLVPAAAIVPLPAPIQSTSSESGEKTEQDTIFIIRKKVFEIVRILRGTLAAEKARSKAERRDLETQKRKKQETKLEKVTPSKDKKDGKKFNVPGKGLLSGIFDFFKNIFLGWFLVNFIQAGVPGGKTLISVIAGGMGFITNLVLGTLDAFGSFLLVGKNAIDGSKKWLKENRGDEAENRFNELIGGLTNLFNAAFIVGSVFATLGIGGKGKGKGSIKDKLTKSQIAKNQKRLAKGTSKKAIEKYTKRYGAEAAKNKFGSAGQAAANRLGLGKSQIIKGGLGRTTTRLVGKTLGPQAMKAIGPIIKKIGAGFSRVPIVGSLIVAISSLLAGDPLGQAAFKGLGSALGGFLGSFVPIPGVGTLIGSIIGTFIGDVLYSLILKRDAKEAGKKFKKGITDALKTMFDLGGLAANFVKDGFKRLVDNFPTVDIPAMAGLQSLLGRFAGLFGVKDDSEFMENGRIVKLPNLALLTPPGLPFLVPHIAASFLPDIFGKSGVVNKIFGKGGTAWGGTGTSASSSSTGSSSTGSSSTGPVKTGDLDSNSGASNVSGEAGKFIEQNLESAAVAADGYGDYNRITEHPDFGGVRGRHANGSYHYSGRAIDVGAFTHEQGPIVDVINQFNKKRGVQPAELITGTSFPGTTMVDPGGHGDHVHIAYGLGGLVKGITHAMLGEKGEEFVIDNDSYTAIEDAFPGLLDAINKAKGSAAVQALMAYTDYEKPQAPQIIMAGGGSASGYSGGDEGGSSGVIMSSSSGGGRSSAYDSLYKYG